MNKNIKVKSKEELKSLIEKEIKIQGNLANLNHLDVSLLTNLSNVFTNSSFNGDISKWDVSNVVDMSRMFYGSKFNGDLNTWNVSQVENMNRMFSDSLFNQNLSSWNVSNVVNMVNMFSFSQFNQDISKWNVSKVKYMSYMFCNTVFNFDLTLWKPLSLVDSLDIFSLNNFFNMFDKSIYPKPYWSDCYDNDELINKIIEFQKNYQLKQKLEEELIDVRQNKNIKL